MPSNDELTGAVDKRNHCPITPTTGAEVLGAGNAHTFPGRLLVLLMLQYPGSKALRK